MTEGGKVKLQSQERVPQQHASTAGGYLGQSQISDGLVTTESKRGRGRPKVEGPRPWHIAGISKRTYYRRRLAEQKAMGDEK